MADVSSNIHQTGSIQTQGLQTSTTILAANTARGAFMIQNQDTAILKLRFGGTATTSVYDVVLKACSVAADGTGGVYAMEDGTVYTGSVTCFSAGTPSYTVLELN